MKPQPTSLLFLLSRGMSVGAVISAPAVVLSLVLDWNLTATALAITLPAVVYTMFGGVQAVTWTDVKIMVLIVLGLFAMIVAAVLGLPEGVGLTDGLGIAASTGRLRSFDFSWDLTNHNVWSAHRRASSSAPTSGPTRARCSVTSLRGPRTKPSDRC